MTVNHPLARRFLVPKPFAEAGDIIAKAVRSGFYPEMLALLKVLDGTNNTLRPYDFHRVAFAHSRTHGAMHLLCSTASEPGQIITAALKTGRRDAELDKLPLKFGLFFWAEKQHRRDPLAACWTASSTAWVQRMIVLSAAEAEAYDTATAEWQRTKGRVAA